MNNIIGICGFIGSGKNSVGEILVDQYGFENISFASSLKDAVSSIFEWDRNLLEGDTDEGRIFREQLDDFWTKKLGYDVTPRKILQLMGTQVFRNNFHNDIWLFSLEKRMSPETDYVITDVRFPNEIKFIQELGGKLVRVIRGQEPGWLPWAKQDIAFETKYMEATTIHPSEYMWVATEFDYIIDNNFGLKELYQNTDQMIIHLTSGDKTVKL